MVRICFQFIQRHLQEIEDSSGSRFSFYCIYRLAQPLISLININFRSESDVIYCFDTQSFISRRHFCTFSQELICVFDTQIMRIHQLIKIFLIFRIIPILDLPHQAFQNFISVSKCIETKRRAVFQHSFPRSIRIFKVTCTHSFMRDTTVRVTVSRILCYHSGCPCRKEQHSHKRFNFHCI